MSRRQFLPFFRITVMGHEKSGKTCLINSFVNNFCPVVYTRTEFPELYYRTVRIRHPDDEAEDEYMTALIEIEDYPIFDDPEAPEAALSDVEQFLKKNPTGDQLRASDGDKLTMPMGSWDAPDVMTYKPLTYRRMGFIVTFDACDHQSFVHAKQVLKVVTDTIDSMQQETKSRGTPVVYLVATKVDMDPLGVSTDFPTVMEEAKEFAAKKEKGLGDRVLFKFEACSAVEFKGVRRVFRDGIIQDISRDRGLWMSNYQQSLETESKQNVGQDGIFGGFTNVFARSLFGS